MIFYNRLQTFNARLSVAGNLATVWEKNRCFEAKALKECKFTIGEY